MGIQSKNSTRISSPSPPRVNTNTSGTHAEATNTNSTVQQASIVENTIKNQKERCAGQKSFKIPALISLGGFIALNSWGVLQALIDDSSKGSLDQLKSLLERQKTAKEYLCLTQESLQAKQLELRVGGIPGTGFARTTLRNLFPTLSDRNQAHINSLCDRIEGLQESCRVGKEEQMRLTLATQKKLAGQKTYLEHQQSELKKVFGECTHWLFSFINKKLQAKIDAITLQIERINNLILEESFQT